MQRRGFIRLAGTAAATWPFVARAQKTKPVIAILGAGAADASSSKGLMPALDTSLREAGLARGRGFLFETPGAGIDAGRYSPLAAQLFTYPPSAAAPSTCL